MVFSISAPARAQFSLLHAFAGLPDSHPWDSLTLDGSTFYGTTGGRYHNPSVVGDGAVFQINTDGTGFNVLHKFGTDSPESDGTSPRGSVTLSGSTLYGTTCDSQELGYSTVFKIGTDGTGFGIVHRFAYNGSEGYFPRSLTLSGSTLYGMTSSGGAGDGGTVFKVNTDGTGFGILHTFAGGSSDGRNPGGSLTLSGSTFYGMTSAGGDNDAGTVFQMNMDGTGFSLLHEFAGGGNDGSNPADSLTLAGSTLYGMTSAGGDSNYGTVFQINTDGTGFNLLHEFAGGGNDGHNPRGSLTLLGSTLYGMTLEGGDGVGTVFQMNADGTGFNLLHEFAGSPTDGRRPYGSLTVSGSTLYGMTLEGGDGVGTVFSLTMTIPEPSTALLMLSGIAFTALRRRRTCR